MVTMVAATVLTVVAVAEVAEVAAAAVVALTLTLSVAVLVTVTSNADKLPTVSPCVAELVVPALPTVRRGRRHITILDPTALALAPILAPVMSVMFTTSTGSGGVVMPETAPRLLFQHSAQVVLEGVCWGDS